MSISLNYHRLGHTRNAHVFQQLDSLIKFIGRRIKGVQPDEKVYLLKIYDEIFVSDNPVMMIVVLSHMFIEVDDDNVDLELFELESYESAYHIALMLKEDISKITYNK